MTRFMELVQSEVNKDKYGGLDFKPVSLIQPKESYGTGLAC